MTKNINIDAIMHTAALVVSVILGFIAGDKVVYIADFSLTGFWGTFTASMIYWFMASGMVEFFLSIGQFIYSKVR